MAVVKQLGEGRRGRRGGKCSFQNGTTQYFRSERGMNSLDVRAAGASTSCCGVNLALSGFGFVAVSLAH